MTMRFIGNFDSQSVLPNSKPILLFPKKKYKIPQLLMIMGIILYQSAIFGMTEKYCKKQKKKNVDVKYIEIFFYI